MNIGDIEGLAEALAAKADEVHDHPTSDITGLVEALAEKALFDHEHDLSDFPDFSNVTANFSTVGHGHSIAQVTGLQDALNSKSGSGHTHPITQVEGLTDALASKSGTSHEHTISQIAGLQAALNSAAASTGTVEMSLVSGLQTALEGKSDTLHGHSISQIANLSDQLAASANVQADWLQTSVTSDSYIKNKPSLGSAALKNVGTTSDDVASGSHTHSASDITTGTLPLSVIPVIPGTITIVTSSLSSLTTNQESQIVAGTYVVVSEGQDSGVRYLYSGTGDKKLASSYVVSRDPVAWEQIVGAPTNASTLNGGLMSAADKVKLDGLAAGANAYVHPTTDGNLHVPATGTNNNGRVLKAGATAGAFAWGTLTASEVGAASTGHSHGNLDSSGRINTPLEGVPVITGPNGAIQAGTTTTFAAGNHAHGSITSDGKMSGVSSRSLLLTGSDGTINTLSVGTSNSGKLLRNNGPTSTPSWEDVPSHTHGNITNTGAIVGSAANRVLVTGTGGAVTALSEPGTAGQVLVSKGANTAPAWEALPASQTSVANLSGGNTGQIAYQSAANTTAFLPTPAVPANDPSGQLRHAILRSGGQGVAPNWLTAGSIITKNQGEYVATDAATGQAGSITKIQRITAQDYTILSPKDATTLYVVVG